MRRKPTEQERQYRKYTRALERHIEWEISLYQRNAEMLADYENEIAEAGRAKDFATLLRLSSDPGDPTANAGARLADTVWLGELREKVRAVERALQRLSPVGAVFVRAWFWENTRNLIELREKCHIERTQCYDWRRKFILLVGVELGWLDPNMLNLKVRTNSGLFAA